MRTEAHAKMTPLENTCSLVRNHFWKRFFVCSPFLDDGIRSAPSPGGQPKSPPWLTLCVAVWPAHELALHCSLWSLQSRSEGRNPPWGSPRNLLLSSSAKWWFSLLMIWSFWGPGVQTSWQSSVRPKTLLRCTLKWWKKGVARPHRATVARNAILGPKNPKP